MFDYLHGAIRNTKLVFNRVRWTRRMEDCIICGNIIKLINIFIRVRRKNMDGAFSKKRFYRHDCKLVPATTIILQD